MARGGGSGEVEEGGVCAKRRGVRASHARGSRRGRAEAREHAGDIPTCPGAKIGLIPTILFPATFPSLPLNGLRLAHLARFGPKSRLKHGGGGAREEEGAARSENFGFCGQIRAVQPPGNSDTEGELGELIRLRERSPQSSDKKYKQNATDLDISLISLLT